MTTTTATGPIKAGRPANDSERARFYNGALYKLLLNALPNHVEHGRLSPTSLARSIGFHKFTVYNWLNKEQVSPRGASKLVEESQGRLTAEDLVKFVIS